MALHPAHRDMGGHRPAPPDLHHVAHPLRAGRLAHQTDRHPFLMQSHPVEQRLRAMQPVALLIAGDGQDNRAVGWRRLHKIHRCCDKCGNTGFHVTGPPSIDHALHDLAAKRVMPPRRPIAHRHHIGMAVEAKGAVGTAPPPAGKQVCDAFAVNPVAFKTGAFQNPLQQHQRPTLDRRHRRAADQIGGQGNGINRCHRCSPCHCQWLPRQTRTRNARPCCLPSFRLIFWSKTFHNGSRRGFDPPRLLFDPSGSGGYPPRLLPPISPQLWPARHQWQRRLRWRN